MSEPRYNRILLKLSGESLMGSQSYGIDPAVLGHFAREVHSVYQMGVKIGLVIGGGNIFRGMQAAANGIDKVSGDYMGMLATLINAIGLQNALEAHNVPTRLQSAIQVAQIAEPFIRRKALRHLEKDRVVLFGAGTGNPYFTTDTAAALRAIEIEAEVIEKKLGVMDMTAITLCQENSLPILVFDMNTPGNLKKLVMGEDIATIVS